ncbi:hypothetical protein BH23GEM10_BH23GEM10_08980 [soil metagenome]
MRPLPFLSLPVALVAAAMFLPAAADAQPVREQCLLATRADVTKFCGNVADAITILQPRIGMAATGGNPVFGTASTLGMRIGSMPRISLGLRVSAAEADLPPVERQSSDDDVSFPIGSVSMDVSAGVFPGLNLLPTVGGFASLDLLASAGFMPLPSGEGFDDSAPFTWAAGARVGLLRESFTAPGVSVSAMYRRLGDATYGSPTLTDRDAHFTLDDQSVTSIRGTAGKRVLGFGLTAGAAWDRYSSDVAGSVRDSDPVAGAFELPFAQDGLTQTRTSYFGNVSFTLLILNMAVELGWQEGGEAVEDGSDRLSKKGVFGGLAVRLAI